ncbi:MAG: SIMPL domain-containing protein [Oligoflexia bacterium]|nr:SIMPL domain-containing protein [Oligoflexia bacterium]
MKLNKIIIFLFISFISMLMSPLILSHIVTNQVFNQAKAADTLGPELPPFNTVVVYGFAYKDIIPNQFDIYLSVHLQKTTKEEILILQDKRMQSIKEELKKATITPEKLVTESYHLGKWQVWENNKNITKGYELSHRLKLTIDNFESLKKLLAELSAIEDVEINSLSQRITTALQTQMENQLYTEAINNAEAKANNMINALKKKNIGVSYVEELPRQTDPMPKYNGQFMLAKGNNSQLPESTEIQIQQIKLEVRVKLLASYQ